VLSTAAINAARFDYNPSTLAPLGLLIEQSSTNLLTYSADVGGSTWTPQGVVVYTGNTTTAPDGTQTASTVTLSTVGNNYFYRGSVGTAGVQHTFSVWLKGLGTTNLVFYDNVSAFQIFPITLTSTLTRYSCTATFGAGSTDRRVGIGNVSGGTATSLNAWGSQLEALAFPTSYIPTTSAQVTRAADNASMTGTNFSSWFNQSQGTIYCEYIGNANNPSSNNQCIYNFGPGLYTASNSIVAILNASGEIIATNLAGTPYSVTATPRAINGKLATSYSSTNLSAVVNNSTVASTTITASSGGLTSVSFGSAVTPIPALNGTIKKFTFYQTALTSAQLQAITT
jgi:hypothetical protein